MRRRGAWRIGMGGSNLFFILPRLDCPLRRRRRASGRGARTTEGLRQPPAADATGPPYEAAPGRSGCPRPDGTPRGLRRRKGWWAAVCAPITAPKLHHSSWDFTSPRQKFEFRGPRTPPGRRTRLDRAVDGSLKFSTLNSPWPWHSKYELVARCFATRGQKLQNLGGPTPFRQKRWIALEAPSPASAAQHCSLPFAQRRRARRRRVVDRGSKGEPTAVKKKTCAPQLAKNLICS